MQTEWWTRAFVLACSADSDGRVLARSCTQLCVASASATFVFASATFVFPRFQSPRLTQWLRSGSAVVAAWRWHPQPSKVRDRSQHVAGAAQCAIRWSPHAPRAASPRTADKEFLRELSSIHQLLLSKDSQLQVGARRLPEHSMCHECHAAQSPRRYPSIVLQAGRQAQQG